MAPVLAHPAAWANMHSSKALSCAASATRGSMPWATLPYARCAPPEASLRQAVNSWIVRATRDTLAQMAKRVVPVRLALTRTSTVLRAVLRAHRAHTRKSLGEVLFAATNARLEPTRWGMPQYAPPVPPTVALHKASRSGTVPVTLALHQNSVRLLNG